LKGWKEIIDIDPSGDRCVPSRIQRHASNLENVDFSNCTTRINIQSTGRPGGRAFVRSCRFVCLR